jgi:hypothetical protein
LLQGLGEGAAEKDPNEVPFVVCTSLEIIHGISRIG